MAKPALFYTLKIGPFFTYQCRMELMKVTTEKRGRYFGSLVATDQPTYARDIDCRGRFETVEQAAEAGKKLQAVWAEFTPAVDAAEHAYNKARRAREDAADTVCETFGMKEPAQ